MIDSLITIRSFAETVTRHAERHGVPGAQAVMICDGKLISANHGVLRNDRAERVDDQTCFQMGSSVKMFTAALVMAALDRKFVSLDAPVRSYLSNFMLEDADAAKIITLRHLLTHTGGFDGDFFKDFGGLDTAIGQYVSACAELEQISKPGTLHSYSNASFPILAHICEHVFKMPWYLSLEKFILQPLGIQSFAHVPSELVSAEHVAHGHLEAGNSTWAPTELIENRSLAPAGAGALCSATDLAKFAIMLLNNGESGHGRYVLQPSSVKAMRSRCVEGPSPTFASAWGLGTMLFDWSNDTTVFGHDGAVPGQYTYVRLHAESKTGLVLMTNGGDTLGFATAMFEDVLAPLINASPLPLPEQTRFESGELEKYTGQFETRSAALEVREQSGHLVLTSSPSSEGEGSVPSIDVDLHPIDRESFLGVFPDRYHPLIQKFVAFDEFGIPQAINFRGRVFPRASHVGAIS